MVIAPVGETLTSIVFSPDGVTTALGLAASLVDAIELEEPAVVFAYLLLYFAVPPVGGQTEGEALEVENETAKALDAYAEAARLFFDFPRTDEAVESVGQTLEQHLDRVAQHLVERGKAGRLLEETADKLYAQEHNPLAGVLYFHALNDLESAHEFPSGEIQAEIDRIALRLEAVEEPTRPPITSSTTSMHSDAWSAASLNPPVR